MPRKYIRGTGRAKVVDLLNDPIGVIVVDGQKGTVRRSFHPKRPLRSIVVLRKTDDGLKVAVEVGMRRRRPYRRGKDFYEIRPEVQLNPGEWELVLPAIIDLLRRWVKRGTRRWKLSSYFYSNQTFVHRRTFGNFTPKYPQKFIRPRFLLVTISHRDKFLCRLFRVLADFTLARPRASAATRMIQEAIIHNRRDKIPAILTGFFPERPLSAAKVGELDRASYLISSVVDRLNQGEQYRALEHILLSLQLSRDQLHGRRTALRGIIDRGVARNFEETAIALLGENGIFLQAEHRERGYDVYRYSLRYDLRRLA